MTTAPYSILADYQTDLVGVILGVWRVPHVYTDNKMEVVVIKNTTTVSKNTLDEVITNLGGHICIGDGNQAGIGRQLHRISAMRSKSDEVFGLTMCVDRAQHYAACLMADLPLRERHPDNAVLVLGHPGSGKNTIIRDEARYVSTTMPNV